MSEVEAADGVVPARRPRFAFVKSVKGPKGFPVARAFGVGAVAAEGLFVPKKR